MRGFMKRLILTTIIALVFILPVDASNHHDVAKMGNQDTPRTLTLGSANQIEHNPEVFDLSTVNGNTEPYHIGTGHQTKAYRLGNY